MLARSFLTTTALVLCVSVAYAARESGRPNERFVPRYMGQGVPAHTVHGFPVVVMDIKSGKAPGHHEATPKYRNAIFDNIDWRDKNSEWLSYYGFTVERSEFSYYFSSHSWIRESENAENALSFNGTGKKAKKIGVPLFTESPSTTEYNVGIYSATASGLPGNELAGGSTTASSSTTCCTQLRWVDVKIKLKKGQEYFLAVSCAEGQSSCDGGWMMEPTGEDYFHFTEKETYNTYYSSGTQHYTFSSPWHESNYYAAEGAAIIK